VNFSLGGIISISWYQYERREDMPSIYLSPSAQEGNFYVTGQSEEEVMNRLADALEPYLREEGITFDRNSPSMGVNQIIRDSNRRNPDLHVALHSNAAPDGEYGTKQGIFVYYYPGSADGKRAAEILADKLSEIYPDPALVRAAPLRSLGELRYTDAPSVFLEVGFHDNLQDANWNLNNLDSIAGKIAEGLEDYFDGENTGDIATVRTSTTGFNLRRAPNTGAPTIASIPNGTRLRVTGGRNGWYRTNYNGQTGYVSGRYLRF